MACCQIDIWPGKQRPRKLIRTDRGISCGCWQTICNEYLVSISYVQGVPQLYVLNYIVRIPFVHNFKNWVSKDLLETKRTKVHLKILLMKTSENNFICLPVFCLILCLMKALKNFEKVSILKIWELVSLVGVKTHFCKIALKWCISDMKKIFVANIMM